MNVFVRLFEQRVRGIRLIELIGLLLALGMVFWVCVSKSREGEDIRRMSALDQQIADEKQSVTDLKVQVARLERPSRLEALAKTYLGMKPVDPNHEADLENLAEISHATSRPVVAPAPESPAAPAAPATTDDVIAPAPAPVPAPAPAAKGAN